MQERNKKGQTRGYFVSEYERGADGPANLGGSVDVPAEVPNAN
jgi:hypothetical protein